MSNSIRPRKAAEFIAETFKEARSRLQLTQQEVAHRARVTPAKVSILESASSDPRLSTVERVAEVLGLEISLTDSAA